MEVKVGQRWRPNKAQKKKYPEVANEYLDIVGENSIGESYFYCKDSKGESNTWYPDDIIRTSVLDMGYEDEKKIRAEIQEIIEHE